GRGGRGFSGLLSSPVIRALGRTPQMRRVGPLLVRGIQDWGLEFGESAWHDPSQITEERWDNYLLPLKVDNWDVGLYETIIVPDSSVETAERLDELDLPILVITGDDDRIVPTENSLRLAERLPSAQLAVLENCGHAPQEECPQPFLEAVYDYLDGLH
nr:alpha/beta hydrolase [Anaerolineae bacterium]